LFRSNLTRTDHYSVLVGLDLS